jgi:purine nucleosidase
VLFAVRPDRGYFELSETGRVRVADDGFTSFEPAAGGRDRFLVLDGPAQEAKTLEALVQLVTQPPCNHR